jgi:UPF0716 family protein affecting phage T7 exclusion
MRRSPIITGLLLFAAWFAAEVLVYNLVSGWVGSGPTLLMFLAKPVLGFMFMAQMLRRKLKGTTGVRGIVLDGSAATDASLKIMGAILLIIPGFLAGLIGLALFTPSVRRMIAGRSGGSRPNPREFDLEAGDWREEPPAPRRRLRRQKPADS